MCVCFFNYYYFNYKIFLTSLINHANSPTNSSTFLIPLIEKLFIRQR